MASIRHKPDSFNLQYAELLDRAIHTHAPNAQGLQFVRKKQGTRVYWYLQHTLGRHKKQYYLGPDSPELSRRIEQQKDRWEQAVPELEERERLVAMCLAGGGTPLPHVAYKFFKALEQEGIFLAGALVVGSFAFQAYGNMLGVDWESAAAQTMDMDIAGGHTMLALPAKSRSVDETLLAVDSSLNAVPSLVRNSPETSFQLSYRGSTFRIDLLTPMTGPTSSKPRRVRGFDAYAKPVRFLDYLLDDVQQAVLLHKEGVLVNVPTPARYALHKLVVAHRRPAAEQMKARKDKRQATLLLRVLLEERPGDIWLAIDAAARHPSAKFFRLIRDGIAELPDALKAPLEDYIGK